MINEIDNLYGSKIDKLANELDKINEVLVTKSDYIDAIAKYIYKAQSSYLVKNVVFTDTHLASAMKQKIPHLHTNVVDFYCCTNETQCIQFGIETFTRETTKYMYNGTDSLRNIAKNMSKSNTLFVINPPFDGTLHLKIFNECKEFAYHVICVHPSTQLQALPTYNNGKDKDFNQYIVDGLTTQEILSFTTFTNTRAFGDIVIDVWDKGCKNKTMQFNHWDYADRCTDKGLYPIIYDAIITYIAKNGTLEDISGPFNKVYQPNNWNVVLGMITTTIGNLLIRNPNIKPYDRTGFTKGGLNVWSNYGHGIDKGLKKWNNTSTKEGYTAAGFETEDEALRFIDTWTTPEANVVINTVVHDQNMKLNLLPKVLSGDIVSQLGLNKYRQRMIDEYNKFKHNQGRYVDGDAED